MITRYEWLLFGIIFVLMATLGYAGNQYNILNRKFTESQLKVKNLQKELALTQSERAGLFNSLQIEKGVNNSLGNQLNEINGQVDTLTKLTQIDKELLQKYSKVYFLNENYVPSKLMYINATFLKDSSKKLQIHANIRNYLQRMLKDSKETKTPLLVVSAYRSFDEQTDLKSIYKMAYGTTGANTFSADQGYSEHQLGTTVDLATASSTTATFEKTEANKWLIDNAYKYGFVLSYPKQNGYYTYEPWHWRFVGVALATKLYDEDKYFYELPQREIDEYLISIFD